MKTTHIKFAEHYVIHGNASEAYQQAFPTAARTTCATNGDKLLRNAAIQAYIKEKQDELAKNNVITKEQILNDLKTIVANNLQERPAIAIKAYDLAVKMLGYNQPIETMVTIKGEQPLFGPLND